MLPGKIGHSRRHRRPQPPSVLRGVAARHSGRRRWPQRERSRPGVPAAVVRTRSPVPVTARRQSFCSPFDFFLAVHRNRVDTGVFFWKTSAKFLFFPPGARIRTGRGGAKVFTRKFNSLPHHPISYTGSLRFLCNKSLSNFFLAPSISSVSRYLL